MISSLKIRIAVWYVSLSTLILLCLGIALYAIISYSMMNERRALRKILKGCSRSPNARQPRRNRLLDEAEEEIPLKPGDEFVEIFTLEGTSLATSPGIRNRQLPFRPDMAQRPPKFETISTSSDGSPALLGGRQFK